MESKKDFEQRMKLGNLRARKASGSVNNSDPLVAFLYILARDHVTSGVVEEIMLRNVEIPDITECEYTNGWLALWAADVAGRLRNQ